MRSPAQAIAWQLWRRHRYGLSLTGLGLLVTYCIFPWLSADIRTKTLGFWGCLVIMGELNLLTVFTYTLGTDYSAKDSGFPPRMFILPVRTSVLVFWPMLLGVVVMAVSWLAVALFFLRPCGYLTPLVWPALLLALFMAWMQAISWWPFALPLVRLLVLVLAQGCLVGFYFLAMAYRIPDLVLLIGLAALLPVGYGVALEGVARARRGDQGSWSWWPHLANLVHFRFAGRGRPFSSAARALLWFEWRRNAMFVPWMVGINLILMMMVPLRKQEVDAFVIWIAFGLFVVVPILLATSQSHYLGKSDYWNSELAMLPFIATRPTTCWTLVLAKLQVAAVSTLVTWGLTFLGVSLWCLLHGHSQTMIKAWLGLFPGYAPWESLTVFLLTLGALMILTFRQMVENLWVGLTGHAWVIHGGSVLLFVSFLGLGMFGYWLWEHPEYQELLFSWLPWLAGLAVIPKIVAAGWMTRLALGRGLLTRRNVAAIVSVWFLAIAYLVLVAWLLEPVHHQPLGWIILGVVLFMPLARILAAPVALQWNRHR